MSPQQKELRAFARSCLKPQDKLAVSQWCQRNLIIPAGRSQESGPFRLHGREYAQEILDDFGNKQITDEVLCFGSQTGKTTIFMAGMSWCLACDPCGALWVMPSLTLAQSFSETRWIPFLKHCKSIASMIPKGADRHDFKKLQQQIGASVLVFVGSNSPGNLSSRPSRRIILDEVDKFDSGGANGEADAVNLAEQRTKSFAYPQRWKSSTPTLSDGLIWQEFLKGDQRRYYVPCPHCDKHVLFAWSPEFTVFSKQGCEAYIRWSPEAKRKDGTWDLDKVQRSTHAVCPHCQVSIEDTHKTRMVRRGQWRPTVTSASRNFVSRQLSSLYACSVETQWGRLAVKFLQAKQSLLGLQGFINGDLAEPWESQDRAQKRVEVIISDYKKPETSKLLMTVDCQASRPHFWFVVRQWLPQETVAVDAGSLDTWEEIEAKRVEHGVEDVGVIVDSGWRGFSENEVYRNCAMHCDVISQHSGNTAVGWTPSKGMPGRKRWSYNGMVLPYYVREVNPFEGQTGPNVRIPLLEFSGDYFKDILEGLRAGRGAVKWCVKDTVATEEYWKHLDAEIKVSEINKGSRMARMVWKLRSPRWPNHLLDCEVMQIAAAANYDLFTLPTSENKATRTK